MRPMSPAGSAWGTDSVLSGLGLGRNLSVRSRNDGTGPTAQMAPPSHSASASIARSGLGVIDSNVFNLLRIDCPRSACLRLEADVMASP